MQKIQVTTAEIKAPAQVILPNTYFISKAVHAQIAVSNFKDYMDERKKHGEQIDPIATDVINQAGDFLQELIDALEGKDHEQD